MPALVCFATAAVVYLAAAATRLTQAPAAPFRIEHAREAHDAGLRIKHTREAHDVEHRQASRQASTTIAVHTTSDAEAHFARSEQLPGMRSISCPVYSGPGYVKERHPSRSISVPALEAPFQSTVHPRRLLKPVPLSDVRLLPTSAYYRAFDTNLRYLKLVDLDSLLLTWRLAAAPGRPWPRGTMRLMGWEHTGSELRGHFLGHWLSAASMSYAATEDADLASSIAKVVDALAECATLHGSGYLSAFPTSFLDRLEDVSPVWAPYYTLHKLLAGLLHVARLSTKVMAAAAATALRLATGLADYIDGRLRRLTAAKGLDHHFFTLNQECGGINEGLWTLAAMTGDARHRALASLFDKPCLVGPLAAGEDKLTGMHGNTALALVVGVAKRSEVTGERVMADVAGRFFDLVDGSRSFVTGGSTLNELWGAPHQLGESLLAGGQRFEHVE